MASLSLREMIEKQRAEKAAKMALESKQIKEIALSPSPPVKAKSFLERLTASAETSKPIEKEKPKVEVKLEIKSEPKPVQKLEQEPPIQKPNGKDEEEESNFAELQRNLVYLVKNMEQPEQLGQVIRRIGAQLHENSQFVSRMIDKDFETIVAAMRKAYKTAVFTKQEGSAKRAAKQAQRDEAQEEIAQFMAEFGIGKSL